MLRYICFHPAPAELLLSQPSEPHAGCRIRLLWFKNGIPQFSARSWGSPWPPERRETQKAKITGWDKSKKQRWDKETNWEANDSHAKCSESPFSPWKRLPVPCSQQWWEVVQNNLCVLDVPPPSRCTKEICLDQNQDCVVIYLSISAQRSWKLN